MRRSPPRRPPGTPRWSRTRRSRRRARSRPPTSVEASRYWLTPAELRKHREPLVEVVVVQRLVAVEEVDIHRVKYRPVLRVSGSALNYHWCRHGSHLRLLGRLRTPHRHEARPRGHRPRRARRHPHRHRVRSRGRRIRPRGRAEAARCEGPRPAVAAAGAHPRHPDPRRPRAVGAPGRARPRGRVLARRPHHRRARAAVARLGSRRDTRYRRAADAQRHDRARTALRDGAARRLLGEPDRPAVGPHRRRGRSDAGRLGRRLPRRGRSRAPATRATAQRTPRRRSSMRRRSPREPARCASSGTVSSPKNSSARSSATSSPRARPLRARRRRDPLSRPRADLGGHHLS